ncbi:lipase 3-like [Wyeomyia smithii]|uniref:lipase 3-like n=1 Tax=Wyeomyia smithii TaxID=174621 RepID=UPI002467B241|nr:lipase 3-like [Wyeomyia smithii]
MDAYDLDASARIIISSNNGVPATSRSSVVDVVSFYTGFPDQCSYSGMFPAWTVAVLLTIGSLWSCGVQALLLRNDCICDPINAFLDSLPLNRERTDQLLEIDGYQGTPHRVVTEDGYVLKLYRIWSGNRPTPVNSSREVILLQHGILHSSADWLVLGPGRSLAYQLVDLGFDVWLANTRSSLNSHQHLKLCTCSKEFWDYSWHELGYYDLAASIDRVLEETNRPRLRLVAFSEGGAMAMVLLSSRPAYNDKLIGLDAMAPGTFVSNTWYRFLALPALKIPKFLHSVYALYATNQLAVDVCESKKQACLDLYYQIIAGESAGMNRTWIDRIYPSLPAGGSMREVMHYVQIIWSKRFAPFDYGIKKNLRLYGRSTPPEYRLDRVTAPINIHYGLADKIVDPSGVQRLASKLINSERLRMRSYNKLQHSDFIYADSAFQIVYKEVIKWIVE